MSKKSQEKYRLLGQCILCGQCPPKGGNATCESCAEKRRNYSKKRVNKRLSNGCCCRCGCKDLVNKRYCEDCYTKHKKSAKKNYEILKDKVFMAYGGYKCNCCGEVEKAFLSIDHIANDGCKHRKEIGQSNCYRWLRDNNYPDGFQVLCMNCQWGRKNCNGVCPHKKKHNDENN